MELARPLYQEQEAYIHKMGRFVLLLFALLQLGAFIMSQFNVTNQFFFGAFTMINLAIQMSAIRPYVYFNMRLLRSMYHVRRMAYE